MQCLLKFTRSKVIVPWIYLLPPNQAFRALRTDAKQSETSTRRFRKHAFRSVQREKKKQVSQDQSKTKETKEKVKKPKKSKPKKKKKETPPVNPLGWKLVIVGRPNVGKSTLFNRLVGRRAAIVHKNPGVTRDRNIHAGSIGGLEFDVIDTAGLEEIYNPFLDEQEELSPAQLVGTAPPALDLQAGILAQTERAVREADIALFLFDAREGITPADEHFARWLRKKSRSKADYEAERPPLGIVLIANKCESNIPDEFFNAHEAFRLGFGAPVAISAEHLDGFGDLCVSIMEEMKKIRPYKEKLYEQSQREAKEGITRIQLAIVGKPNVGKSTLINTILGEDRVLVGHQPGITRDSISVEWKSDKYPNYKFQLVDTAGLKGAAFTKVPRYSQVDTMAMSNSLYTMDYANIVVLCIDATEGLDYDINLQFKPTRSIRDREEILRQKVKDIISKQDLAIARKAINEGRGLILLATKWDLIPASQRKQTLVGLNGLVQHILPEAKGLPLVPVSAQTGENIGTLLPAVINYFNKWNMRISTGKLNRWLQTITSETPPKKTVGTKKQIHVIKYISQVKTRPPTFTLFCNTKKALADDYLRFLNNQIRKEFRLEGVPIRLLVRGKFNPFVDE